MKIEEMNKILSYFFLPFKMSILVVVVVVVVAHTNPVANLINILHL